MKSNLFGILMPQNESYDTWSTKKKKKKKKKYIRNSQNNEIHKNSNFRITDIQFL